jgi:hypothetical protein
MESSPADSRVNWLKTCDISETESVSETSDVFKQLTRLSAGEDFIQFCRRESLKPCIKLFMQGDSQLIQQKNLI